MKAEWAMQIEAVGPRMKLAPQTVAKLQQWSDRAADLRSSFYAGISTDDELNAANKKAMALGEAHSKAEIRALGGLDAWNLYGRLRGESNSGTIDFVDDNGEWPRRKPAPGEKEEKPIVSSDHFGRPPDSSEFDRYFAD